MYYSYVEIEYIATSFSPARTDLAVKLLTKSRRRGVAWNGRVVGGGVSEVKVARGGGLKAVLGNSVGVILGGK
jgi:hypothetical protein